MLKPSPKGEGIGPGNGTLKLNSFRRLFIMCKGYSEDFDNFTELVWEDDKNLDFYDQEIYPEFQLWLVQRSQFFV